MTQPARPSPAPVPVPPIKGSPFAGLPRFGTRATGELLPMQPHILRVDLKQIGQPLFDYLGLPVPEDTADLTSLFKMLAEDKTFAASVREKLDAVWDEYHLVGAIFVYSWGKGVHEVAAHDYNGIADDLDFITLMDPALALNILCRARGSLLLARAPVAFDLTFVARDLALNDERIIAHAVATNAMRHVKRPAAESDVDNPFVDDETDK